MIVLRIGLGRSSEGCEDIESPFSCGYTFPDGMHRSPLGRIRIAADQVHTRTFTSEGNESEASWGSNTPGVSRLGRCRDGR